MPEFGAFTSGSRLGPRLILRGEETVLLFWMNLQSQGGYCSHETGHFYKETHCLLTLKISMRWIGRRAGRYDCRRDNGRSQEHARSTVGQLGLAHIPDQNDR